MIRLIVVTSNCAHVVYGGAAHADTRSKTFDIENPELEEALKLRDYESTVLHFELLEGRNA